MVENKWSGQNPWMGLAPYTEGTTLYGRSEECLVLSEIIKNNVASIVFGKSGIGKSSLLSAGISPLLREEDYVPLRIRLVHNTEATYVDQIKKTIKESIVCDDQLQASVPEFGLWDFFHRHEFYSENGEKCVPVIILDQFEEIYTLTDNEHKNAIIDFFSELSSLLNDIKPDAVIEYEKSMDNSHADEEGKDERKGFVLKRSRGKSIKYLADINFRLVVCLREDKLYLLERNSANIPSFKTNRYNLRALSPQSATEVIMCPRPDLFSNEEAIAIVDKISDMGEEGTRTVDPAILSLFLYKYFEKRGATNYDNIFAEYYMESTSGIRSKSMAFLENHLLTLSGYRNQIPLDDAIKSGVSHSEINELLEKVILRTEKRKDIDYIEFSHDRLCEEAKRCRDERLVRIQRYESRRRMLIITFFILCICSILYIGYYNNTISTKNAELAKSRDSLSVVSNRYSALYTMYKNRGDSLARKNYEINITKDSLATLSNERLRLLDIKEFQKRIIEIQNDTLKLKHKHLAQVNEIIKTSRDSINIINKNLNYVNQSLGLVLNNKQVFDEVVRLLCNIRNAYQNQDLKTLEFYTESLMEYEVSYASCIECVSGDIPSLDGHLVFDTDYLYAYINGENTSVYNKNYERFQHLRGAVEASWVLTKTFTIKANGITKLRFLDNGGTLNNIPRRGDFALITEPNGLIDVVIINKTTGERESLKENNGKGTHLCQFPLFFSDRMIYEFEIDVINCTDNDISFVLVTC